jgi:hypothetical protein
MSIRLDPRRLGTLKQLAAEAGVRPGDLVRQWVEERIDAARQGLTPQAMADLAGTLAALAERVAALEGAAGTAPPRTPTAAVPAETPPAPEAPNEHATVEPAREATAPPAARAGTRTTKKKRVAARPATHRVPLHEEMIAVLAERGPLSAAELAAAVSERGRYTPPRSGKPIDAAMVSQRASNPTYRPRFTRNAGHIGLAAPPG